MVIIATLRCACSLRFKRLLIASGFLVRIMSGSCGLVGMGFSGAGVGFGLKVVWSGQPRCGRMHADWMVALGDLF
jgi:hypothetical protein